MARARRHSWGAITRLLIRGFAATAIALAIGCEEPPPPAPAPPKVTVATPLTYEVTDWDEYTGRLAAIDSVDVRARVSGYLESAQFEEGSLVKTGDPLFVIDRRPFQAALDEAKARLTSADVQLQLARNDLQRAQNLFKSRAVSEEELDARVQGEKESLAALEAAKAAVDAAGLNLEFTEVRAPIAGRIGRKLVTEGNLVQGGDADSTLLTTIVSLDPIYLEFTVDERAYLEYARLDEGVGGATQARGRPVRARLADEDEFGHMGYLHFVDNQIDEATNTLLLRALLPNPNLVLTPGLFARVQVQGKGPYPALLIPDEAVLTDQGQRFVFIVGSDGKAARREVKPGRLHDGLRAIDDGLAATDTVVVKGMQRVRPGAAVTAEKMVIEAARSAPKQPGP